ncbi:MAG: tRNA 4-thiouridine(8) synthase ThiI [Verrucomicrobia bacterium]|nr:tRNA 4-thiouridine(8) synthase ThiI [Verrucomicrobiota bacterium]
MRPFDRIIIHYDEIGLKAGNRGYFERLLMDNMRRKLGTAFGGCQRQSGQLTLTLAKDGDRDAAIAALACIPGIANYARAWRAEATMDDITACALSLVAEAEASFTTFKVATRRHDKHNDLRSMDISRHVGAAILAATSGKQVRMASPDLVVNVAVTGNDAYLFVERQDGVGGLPTNSRQKVMGLLSGGLDSPVAAYLMMKRGCEVVLVHFQNNNQERRAVEDKIHLLAGQLSRFQLNTRLHIVPFEGLQRCIVKHAVAAQRMLIYRRVMLQLAGRMATPVKARFLVTGDCLSQVASQTYDNLLATYVDAPLPVLSPLIGLDKREIVDLSRRIGTYDISALPYDDCCSLFLPKHPELRARVADLQDQEAGMDLEPAMVDALAGAVVVDF